MLGTRILTAIVIVLITLGAVFLAPAWLFRLLVTLMLLVGCWEFRRIADLPEHWGLVLVGLQGLILGGMLWLWPVAEGHALWVLLAACVCWLLMFLRLAKFQPGEPPDADFRRLSFFSAVAALTFGGFALFWLRDLPRGDVVVFLLILLIWASDVGAYFSGRLLGRNKLAPAISPNKTREGVYGGIVLSIAAGYLLANIIVGLDAPVLSLVAISTLTTLASVGGDLFISIHKRTVGLADTGSLFPGHGGVLDRYDSLIAGAPFFALAYGVLAQ